MTTLSNLPILARVRPFFDPSAWRTRFAGLVAAWKAGQRDRADSGIDDYFRRARDERERFLSKATDHYQLEHLERTWERRHTDMWRVY